MKITAEELRKVYGEAVHSAHGTQGLHSTGLLAVARYVAQRQRDQEPTPEMELAAAVLDQDDNLCAVYRAMQSVAPLVVE